MGSVFIKTNLFTVIFKQWSVLNKFDLAAKCVIIN